MSTNLRKRGVNDKIKVSKIECLDLFGLPVTVDTIQERSGAYSLIIHKRKIVLLDTKSTGKQWLPGGSIEPREKSEECVIREAKEELGVAISVISEYFHNDYNFFYNQNGKGYHCNNVYYVCQILQGTINESFRIRDHEAERPHWADIKTLKVDDFHPFIQPLIEKVKQDFA